MKQKVTICAAPTDQKEIAKQLKARAIANKDILVVSSDIEIIEDFMSDPLSAPYLISSSTSFREAWMKISLDPSAPNKEVHILNYNYPFIDNFFVNIYNFVESVFYYIPYNINTDAVEEWSSSICYAYINCFPKTSEELTKKINELTETESKGQLIKALSERCSYWHNSKKLYFEASHLGLQSANFVAVSYKHAYNATNNFASPKTITVSEFYKDYLLPSALESRISFHYRENSEILSATEEIKIYNEESGSDNTKSYLLEIPKEAYKYFLYSQGQFHFNEVDLPYFNDVIEKNKDIYAEQLAKSGSTELDIIFIWSVVARFDNVDQVEMSIKHL